MDVLGEVTSNEVRAKDSGGGGRGEVEFVATLATAATTAVLRLGAASKHSKWESDVDTSGSKSDARIAVSSCEGMSCEICFIRVAMFGAGISDRMNGTT